MVKCGEDREATAARVGVFGPRQNSNQLSSTPSPTATPDPGVDLRSVSTASNSSDDDSVSGGWRCPTSRSKCCHCCTECYDDEAISLFYELQLENPQSKTIYRRQSSEELVAISDLFDEEPFNARIEAKTVPTARPPPLPPIPLASASYSEEERRVLFRIRTATESRRESRRGSLAIVDELLHQINDHIGRPQNQRKRRYSSWDSDNGSTSSFSSSSKSLTDFALETFTAKQLELKGRLRTSHLCWNQSGLWNS